MNKTQENTLKLVAAILVADETQIVYRDKDGVVSVRRVIANNIARCDNGSVIVNCFDLDRDAPRKFRLVNVLAVNPLGVVVVG